MAILAEEGPGGLTTNRIAERAGVGIASLYRYYPDKEAILADLFEEKVRAIDVFYRQTLSAGALDAMTLREQIRHMVATPVALSRELLDLHRDFFSHHHVHFEITYRSGPEDRLTWEEWAEQWWRETLERHRDELRVSHVGHAAIVVLAGLRGAIDSTIRRHPEELFDPAFVDELIDMASSYLLGDQAAQ